jgi:1-acyl-sn-glycerol-3-phosphate acyltransferase
VSRALADVRSLLLWAVSLLHFVPATIGLVLLRLVLSSHRLDWLLRLYCRTIVRLAGMRLEVRRSPGFDPDRPCFFAGNHVNVFDPFVVYSSVPPRTRGLELESHFRIPVYGWLMRRFGNVPVPDRVTREGVARLEEGCRAAIAAGTSLIVFPEGTRTRDGRVGPFRPGVFRLAAKEGIPITPVSLVGAFEFQQVSGWRLTPGPVVVHLHDTIDVRGRTADEIRSAVRAVVRGPVGDSPESSAD